MRQDTVYRLDAFEKEQRKAKPILFWEVGLILPVVLLYTSARAYMIVDVFASLRELPAGVFLTFNAADLLPPAPCGRGSAWRTTTLRLGYLTSAFMNLPL